MNIDKFLIYECFLSSSVLKIVDIFYTMFLLQLYYVLKLYALKPMVRVRFEKSCYPHLNLCFFRWVQVVAKLSTF